MTAPEPDLMELLGVTLPKGTKRAPVEAGQKPPRAKAVRFTDWNNFQTFTFGGYLARVTRAHCQCCDNLFDTFEGIFIEEVHVSGTRRLQQLARGAQWPQGDLEHRKEVAEVEVEYCGDCIGDLGFGREVDAKGQPLALVKREGVGK
jgi:hypothetical protein